MNPTDPSDPLLDALLTDRNALEAMHAAGLAALRRQRWWRAARWTVGGVAALAACWLFAMRTPRNEHGEKRAVVLASAPRVALQAAPTVPTAPVVSAPKVREIDDDELVRQFPPGTCTIAEVGGRKMLVFLSNEARAKYLR